jgi:hypothetical protein
LREGGVGVGVGVESENEIVEGIVFAGSDRINRVGWLLLLVLRGRFREEEGVGAELIWNEMGGRRMRRYETRRRRKMECVVSLDRRRTLSEGERETSQRGRG